MDGTTQEPPRPLETTIPIENGNQVAMLVTSTLAIAITTLLVGLRFWAGCLVHRRLDASDLCILAALVFNIGLHVDMYIMVLLGGFGFHGYEIVQRFGMDTLVLFLKGILAFPIIWNFTICFSKLSVLFMYVTVIPVRRMVVACRAVGLFIVLWNTGGVLGALLLCRPISLNWDKSGAVEGSCGDNRLFYIWLGIINVIAEAVILLLPLPFLYNLQLKLFKKLVVIGLFSVGWLTCAVTIYRQATLPHLYFEDMTYTGVLATIFTGVEPAVALSLACVPFLRPLLRRVGLGGSQSDSSGQYATATLRSKGPSAAGSRAFKELSDDSSEIQLRPMAGDTLKYEAEVGHGGQQPEEHHQQQQPPPPEGHAGAIVVNRRWDVVSGVRPGSD